MPIKTFLRNIKVHHNNKKEIKNDYNNFLISVFNLTNVTTQGNRLNSDLYASNTINPNSLHKEPKLNLFGKCVLNDDLTSVHNRALILTGILRNLYFIHINNLPFPNVIIIGNKTHACLFKASAFTKYLSKYSSQLKNNEDPTKLTQNLEHNDIVIDNIPFNFKDGDSKSRERNVKSMLRIIKDVACNHNNYKFAITLNNLRNVYDKFVNIAFKNPNKINSVERVDIFMHLFILGTSKDYSWSSDQANDFIIKGKFIKMNKRAVTKLIKHYKLVNLSNSKQIQYVADNLLDTDTRRNHGQFYTPNLWAKRADSVIHKVVDSACTHHNYHKDALIWDCACGTRNLTAPFHDYKDLYTSTYYQAELNISSAYNKDCKDAFQYDYLKDDIKIDPRIDKYDDGHWKIPRKLYKDLVSHNRKLTKKWNQHHTLKDRINYNSNPVVFYTNPPYGTASEGRRKYSKDKAGLGKDKGHITINQMMLDGGYSGSAQQLYAQFYYRTEILIKNFGLKNAYIAFFSTPQFLSGGNFWEKFNKVLFYNFKLKDGFMFNSGEFSGTESNWSIAFLIFKHKVGRSTSTNKIDVEASKKVGQKDTNVLTFDPKHHKEITSIGKHVFNRVYKEDFLSTWAKKNIRRSTVSQRAPQMASGININKGNHARGVFRPNSLGYLMFSGDNVEYGTSGVWLSSASIYDGNGYNVMPVKDSIDRALVAFTARKVITRTWINGKDNYRKPNTNSKEYPRFVNDALIYTLFGNSSCQISLRAKGYSNTGIKNYWANKWFWLDPRIAKNVLSKHPNNIIAKDLKRYPKESYIYKLMQTRHINVHSDSLSKCTRNLLILADKVWIESFKYRKIYASLQKKYGLRQYPRIYINTWDAGWFQIKDLVNNHGIKNLMLKDPTVKTNDTGLLQSFVAFKKELPVVKRILSQSVYDLGMLGGKVKSVGTQSLQESLF